MAWDGTRKGRFVGVYVTSELWERWMYVRMIWTGSVVWSRRGSVLLFLWFTYSDGRNTNDTQSSFSAELPLLYVSFFVECVQKRPRPKSFQKQQGTTK